MKNKVYIGCSGFSERLWKGFFYPENLPSKDYLSFYAMHLNAVEINSTFYRKPTLKTLTNWYNSTPEDFKFFIKIPKTITHLKRLNDSENDVKEFCSHIFSGLKEKLAGFLFQFPPSFINNEENLQKIMVNCDKQFLNVIEFRHQSWWTEEVMNILESEGIIFSGVSFPKNIPNHVVINSLQNLYYRLHGVPELFKSEYTEEELNDLAKEIQKFKGTSYIFFNNTFGIAGIKNALYLKEKFGHLS